MLNTTAYANRRSTRSRARRCRGPWIPDVAHLEPRVLLTGDLPPAEHLPLGFDLGEQTSLVVLDQLDDVSDRDRYRVDLNAGDVLGVTIEGRDGLNPTVSLTEPQDGTLLWFNDDHGNLSWFLPVESPLPVVKSSGRATDSVLYYVIDRSGSYDIEVAAAADTNGGVAKYRMEAVVARPGMEAEPVGARQVLFVDFDGARINSSEWTNIGEDSNGQKTLSPLTAFMANWGFSPDQEPILIDMIMEVVEENLRDDIRAQGDNGYYPDSSVPGEFDIEIRNSLDHPDEYGTNPYVSRVVVGGTTTESGFDTVAIAEGIDFGNFKFDDQAVVLLDWLSAPLGTHPASLNRFDLIESQAGDLERKMDAVAEVIGSLVSHEAGHNFGLIHTDQDSASPNIMDPRPARFILSPEGVHYPHVDLDFGPDDLWEVGTRDGQLDTLDVLSFSLATGKATASLLAAGPLSDSFAAGTADSLVASSMTGPPTVASIKVFGANEIDRFEPANVPTTPRGSILVGESLTWVAVIPPEQGRFTPSSRFDQDGRSPEFGKPPLDQLHVSLIDQLLEDFACNRVGHERLG